MRGVTGKRIYARISSKSDLLGILKRLTYVMDKSARDQNLLEVKFVHCTLNKLKVTFVPRPTLSHFTCVRETEMAFCCSL